MHGLYVELRSLSGAVSMSADIARHLYARQMQGKIAVITKTPAFLMPSVSKQWRKVIRYAQRERSSTLNVSRILELSHEITVMQRMRLVAKPLIEEIAADVFFATVEWATQVPPDCHTMYVTEKIDDSTLDTLTQNMPHHGLVVLYDV